MYSPKYHALTDIAEMQSHIDQHALGACRAAKSGPTGVPYGSAGWTFRRASRFEIMVPPV
jgi:hypothetical protein